MSKILSTSVTSLSREVKTSTENAEMPTTVEKVLGIGCGLVFYLFLGLEETIMVSYYSLEAKKRGLSTLETGLGYAAMEVSNFLASFILMYFIKQSSRKTFCVLGVLIAAAGASTLGALQWVQYGRNFVLTSVIIESVKGVGVATSLATVLPLITVLSLENAGKITSSADALLSLGCMIGPPLGSVLFHYFGFFVPSIVVGSALFLCAALMHFVLPGQYFMPKSSGKNPKKSRSKDPKAGKKLQQFSLEESNIDDPHQDDASDKFDPWAYFKFCLNPFLITISSVAVIVAAQVIFFEVCLPLYLHRTFGLSVIKIGFTCSAFTISMVCLSFIYGIFVDRGYAVHVMIITSVGFSLSFFLLYLPSLFPSYLENLWFMVPCFVLAGSFAAGANVPAYLVLEKFALANGFSNLSQIKLLVATRCSNSMAIGEVLGTIVISGMLYDTLGFYGTCLAVSSTMALFLLFTALVLHKMKLMKKLYYEDEVSSKQLQQKAGFISDGSSAQTFTAGRYCESAEASA